MAHITRFIIVYKSDNTQQIVGYPLSNRNKAEAELQRLITEEGYDRRELSIVEIPN